MQKSLNHDSKNNPKYTNNCVLFVLSESSKPGIGANFQEAQDLALREEIPIAVIYCQNIWNEKKLLTLLELETLLHNNNIPLLALIGPKQATLAGVIHHTSPAKIFFNQPNTPSQIRKHPFKWPGVIITISELIRLQKSGKINCM